MTLEDEQRLLHEICRNSSMGVEAIHQVLKDVYDEELAYELNIEAGKMQEFERKAGKRLKENGSEPSKTKPAAKSMLKTAIRMKTTFQNNTTHIADMMRKGNRRGAEELKKAMHKYKDAGIYATELAREMIDFEEDNLKKLKSYLEE